MDNGECPIASLEEDGGDEANVKERRGQDQGLNGTRDEWADDRGCE